MRVANQRMNIFASLSTVLLMASVTVGQQTDTPAQPPSAEIESSPLSAYQSATPYHLGKVVPATHLESIKPPKTVTKVIDLKQSIQTYATTNNLPMMDARLEAITFLGLSPRKANRRLPTDGPTFELSAVDVFRVTAPEAFFKVLPFMIKSFEDNKAQIMVNVRILEIDAQLANRVNQYLKPGTEQVVCSKLPNVTPIATDRLSFAADSFVSTSTTVRENLPVTMGQLTHENTKRLMELVQTEPNCAIAMAPSILVYPGQVGTVSDVSYRPFVVGLTNRKSETGKTAVQPVVQPIEDGTSVRVRGIPLNDKIRLFADAAISEILDVKQFTFTSGQSQLKQSVQIPKQKIRQVHFSVDIEPGHTVLVNPNFVSEKESKGGNSPAIKTKTLLLFRASVVKKQ